MIDHLDHLVLTTTGREACVDFYTRVLGMELQTFGAGRLAFRFGAQKINLHERGREFEPKAHLPVPGALDLCFIASRPLDEVIAHLQACAWPIIEHPSCAWISGLAQHRVPRLRATAPGRLIRPTINH